MSIANSEYPDQIALEGAILLALIDTRNVCLTFLLHILPLEDHITRIYHQCPNLIAIFTLISISKNSRMSIQRAIIMEDLAEMGICFKSKKTT